MRNIASFDIIRIKFTTVIVVSIQSNDRRLGKRWLRTGFEPGHSYSHPALIRLWQSLQADSHYRIDLINLYCYLVIFNEGCK